MIRSIKVLLAHLGAFGWVWIILLALPTATFLAYNNEWNYAEGIIIAGLLLLLWLFWRKPMNVVYGLMGKTGNLKNFVTSIIFLNLVFSVIYFFGFFKDSCITYDINQPYISYNMKNTLNHRQGSPYIFGEDQKDTTFILGKAKQANSGIDGLDTLGFYTTDKEVIHYQEIGYLMILRNTIMTSLMQEPTDFFANASTYNDIDDDTQQDIEQYQGYDKDKSKMFHWLLILQVFFSWIFFGVFISILYSKFRYEA